MNNYIQTESFKQPIIDSSKEILKSNFTKSFCVKIVAAIILATLTCYIAISKLLPKAKPSKQELEKTSTKIAEEPKKESSEDVNTNELDETSENPENLNINDSNKAPENPENIHDSNIDKELENLDNLDSNELDKTSENPDSNTIHEKELTRMKEDGLPVALTPSKKDIKFISKYIDCDEDHIIKISKEDVSELTKEIYKVFAGSESLLNAMNRKSIKDKDGNMFFCNKIGFSFYSKLLVKFTNDRHFKRIATCSFNEMVYVEKSDPLFDSFRNHEYSFAAPGLKNGALITHRDVVKEEMKKKGERILKEEFSSQDMKIAVLHDAEFASITSKTNENEEGDFYKVIGQVELETFVICSKDTLDKYNWLDIDKS